MDEKIHRENEKKVGQTSEVIDFDPGSEAALCNRYALPGAYLGFDDLRDIVKICTRKALEAGKIEANYLRQKGLIDEGTHFSLHQNESHLREIFLPYFTVSDDRGNQVSGRDAKIFEDEVFPRHVLHFWASFDFEYKFRRNVRMKNRADMFIDFGRFPLALDFRFPPSNPTPNETNLEVFANDRAWASDLHREVLEIFQDKRSIGNWLHQSTVYDILLFMLGFPTFLYLMFHIDASISAFFGNEISNALRFFFYLCAFFVSIALFRFIFAYVRWAFPLFEYTGKHRDRGAYSHRRFLYTLFIAYIAAILVELTKFLF